MAKLIIFLLAYLSTIACFGFTSSQKQELIATNIITKNSGFESGLTGWTPSGSPTTYEITSTTADVGEGKYALTFDPSGDGDGVETDAYTIPSGLFGRNGVACVRYKGSDLNVELNIIDGSSNEIASEPLSASSNYTELCINFIFPSSGTVKGKLEAEGNGVTGSYDSMLIGDASRVNISQISQATMYAHLGWEATTGCYWTGTGTVMTSFAADASCDDIARTAYGNTTSGTAIGDADGQYPKIEFTNLPPGYYQVVVTGNFHGYDNFSTTNADFEIWDGTTSFGYIANAASVGGTTGLEPTSNLLNGMIKYDTTQASVTFEVRAKKAADDINVSIRAGTAAGHAPFSFTVYRYPLSSQTAYKADTTPLLWEGKHDTDCAWSTTSNTPVLPSGDAVCTFTETLNKNFGTVTSDADGTGNQSGINFTSKKTGVYEMCVDGSIYQTTVDARSTMYLYIEGAEKMRKVMSYNNNANARASFKLCDMYEITSIGENIDVQLYWEDSDSGSVHSQLALYWSIKDVTQNFPMPQILNNVESSASGGVRTCSADITNGGSAAIASQEGSCVDSVTWTATGRVTVTFNSGVFSIAPRCNITPTANSARLIATYDKTTTVVKTLLMNSAGGAADTNFNITCWGDK